MRFMRKTLRILLKTLKVLLWVLLALLVFVLVGGLGPTVRFAGPAVAKMLGADLSIGKCVILPLGGYVRIEGLRVENPKAFSEGKPKLYRDDPLLALGTVELDVGMRSLLAKEYVIDTLRVEGLRALYAFDLGTTNVDALMAQMGLAGDKDDAQAPAGEEPKKEAKEEPKAPAAEGKELRFRVGYLHFGDNVVTVRKYVPITLPLPPITLHDVDNATLKARIDATLAPVYKAVRTLGEGLGSATEVLGDGASAVKGLVSDGADLSAEGLKNVTEGLSDGLKGVGEGAKETLDGLKGLFKKQK